MKKSKILTALLGMLLLVSCSPTPSGNTNASTTDVNTTTQSVVESTTETKEPDAEISSLKQSDWITDPAIWETPTVRGEDFIFTVEEVTGNELLRKSMEYHGIGNFAGVYPSQTFFAAEWGYSVLNMATGSMDGAGRVINNVYLDGDPRTREEALAIIREFFLNQYIQGSEHPWYSMNGHHCWHHYAAEFGCDILGSEIGENIHGYQLHIAMNRGAARQYGKAWFIDFSSWHGAGILDYSQKKYWGEYSSPDNGHSINLLKRSMIASYMSGADGFVAEGGGYICVNDTVDPETGVYSLTPYGEACKEFKEFTQANPDVGITYTPVAVVLDYYHGMDRQPDHMKAFGKFEYTAGDTMTHELIDLIWNDTWSVERNGNEKGALSNNDFGDSFDFLLQNASPEVLASYPALLLSGDIVLSEAEIDNYRAYVQNGGTLVLNNAYLKYFPEYTGELVNDRYDVTDGEGRVIVYGPDHSIKNLRKILKELIAEYIPFSYSDDIQSIVNIADGYFYLTLMNNEGITKTHHQAPDELEAKYIRRMTRDLTISYTGDHELLSVTDIYGGRKVSLDGKELSVTLKPGEIVVLKIKVK